MTRREFLQVFGSSALMSAGGCRTGLTGTKPRYALQLYSVHQRGRDRERLVGTLAAAGAVRSWADRGRSPEDAIARWNRETEDVVFKVSHHTNENV